MGILDMFRNSRAPRETASAYARGAGYYDLLDAWTFTVDSLTVEDLYRTQPHLRTVTSYIAQMVSAVSLHVYEREADGGRRRVRPGDTNDRAAGTLAELMLKPSGQMLMSSLLTQTVMDLCLYDEWVWMVTGGPDGATNIYPIPPRWITRHHYSDSWTFSGISIMDDRSGEEIFIPADSLVRHHGYNPDTLSKGVSPLLALKDVLKQNAARGEYLEQLWNRGPRMAGFIERPTGVKWSPEDRRRFKADLRHQFAAGGSGAGGVALLEDGMKFTPHHLKASDEQVVEQTKLSLETVAQVYHINPTMVGVLDNANYSNVKEFRQALYGDSLLPIMKVIEDSINGFLVPMLGVDSDRYYVEFNMQERLRSQFVDQAAVTSTAVGAPWMTRNEARVMNNLPKIDGGDELAEPLNTDFGSDNNDPPDNTDELDTEEGEG